MLWNDIFITQHSIDLLNEPLAYIMIEPGNQNAVFYWWNITTNS